MTTPTAVARAVARDAEQRARAALDDVLAAHTTLRAADTALATAVDAQAAAGPALAKAISAALDVGITTDHLTELGITAPTARTLRRRRPRTRNDPEQRTPNDTEQRTPNEHRPGGHQATPREVTRGSRWWPPPCTPRRPVTADPSWPDQDAATGHDSAPSLDDHGHPAAAGSW